MWQYHFRKHAAAKFKFATAKIFFAFTNSKNAFTLHPKHQQVFQTLLQHFPKVAEACNLTNASCQQMYVRKKDKAFAFLKRNINFVTLNFNKLNRKI